MAPTTSITLRADTTSVRLAREFVRGTLTTESVVREDCELLVSELATNAVLHAGTAFRVAVHDGAGTIRVEVSDGDPTVPELQHDSPDAITGRGLQIVDRIADRWGVSPSADGKAVWFEIDR